MAGHWRSLAAVGFFALLLAGCGSNSQGSDGGTPANVPDAPLGVSAAAGDGSATVSWQASAGATGYRVYYNAYASGAVTANSPAVDASLALSVEVDGLVDGTAYRFAVAARNAKGEGPLSTEADATPLTTAPFTIASLTPADGASGVSINTPITLVFSRAVTVNSVTGQATAGACSGSVQLSGDNFSSCAAIGATPSATGSTTFDFTPPAALQTSTTYLIRVTTGVHDQNGTTLAATFTQADGFTTAAAAAPLSIASTSPADQASNVAASTSIAISFNEPATPSSIDGQAIAGACSGSVQLSSDNFSTCAALGPAASSSANQTFTFTPPNALTAGATYLLRVTTSALAANGTPLAQTFTLANGFTTAAAIVPFAVSSISPADAAAHVTPATSIVITFNRAATAASISGQAADGACSGSVQLSSNNFTSCIALGTPVASGGNTVFTFAPAELLADATNYAVKVTTDALDANGLALAQTFSSAHGFTTGTLLQLESVVPSDGQINVSPEEDLTLSFNAQLDASTALGNLTDNACTGSLQVSWNNFAANTCVQLREVEVEGTQITLSPATYFPQGATLQLLVTTELHSSEGIGLSSNYLSAGFSTRPALAVTQVSPDGESNVGFTPVISIGFSRPVGPDSVSGNLGSDTSCSGTIQLSKASDAFAANTCVPMTATPSATDDTTFTFTPAQRLASNTKYQVRIVGVLDPTQLPMLAAYTSAGFTTQPFAIAQISPADGASGAARNGPIVVTFNRPAGAASLGSGNCAGPFVLTQSGESGCTTLATPVISGNTVTLQPSTPLAGASIYKLQIGTALLDDSGSALPAAYAMTTGFTTLPALAVASTLPAAGATGVSLNTNLQITFNQPTTAASITAKTASASGCGSIALIESGGSACLPFTAQPASLDGTTFTLIPASSLAASQSYALTVSTAAEDATGAPLPAQFSATFTTGSAVDTTPPGEVTSLIATAALQSIELWWTNPGDADFSKVRVHQCASADTCSSSDPLLGEISGAPGAEETVVLTSLAPSTSYTLLLTTVDQSGNESAGDGDTTANATTQFSGHQFMAQSDFTEGQEASAVGAGTAGDSISVWFTWSADTLYAAMANSGGTALLASNKDVLWIAVDTDPDLDQTGETRTPTVGNNEVIWPFNADYIVQLIPDSFSSSVQVRAAGGCALIHQPAGSAVASDCANASGAGTFDGSSGTVDGLAELSIPATAFGGSAPAKVRLAFAAIDSTNGYAYALAPANPQAIDVIGFFGSATSSFDPGANIWNPSLASSSASASVSPLSQAASLVTVSAQASTLPSLKGSLHPLSYTLSDVSFSLRDDGSGGDVTAGDGIYTGAFNFGGSTQQLFFKFGQSSGDEFASGSDRIWTLGGASESLPLLSYGTAYSANHQPAITFEVINPGGTSNMKQVLGNVSELDNFNPGAQQGLMHSLGSGTWTTYPIDFSDHDFTKVPLQWKAYDIGSATWESDWPSGPVQNHEMNDDVINSRIISWTWNDYSQDPF